MNNIKGSRFLNNGSTKLNTGRRERPGYYRHNLLVCSACAANMEKLPDKKYAWSTSKDDVAVVNIRGTVWRLCCRPALQHTAHYSAAVLLRTLRG
jgi:hypothetical protein